MPGVPGLRRMDHVGFTVPDISEAHDFLVAVLGCEYLYKQGPVASNTCWMQEHLNVDPRSVLTEMRVYRCGGQAIFEVFEFEAPDQQIRLPRNSDHGGHHIALYVDDIDVAVDYLREHGISIVGTVSESAGASQGQRWVYFLAPWGMHFEFVSYPHGRAFDLDPSLFR